MHISVVTLLLSTWLITTTFGQQQNIRFAFFYPFGSPEISHPPIGTYNITEVLDYGIQLFENSPLGQDYNLSYISFNTNCAAREGNRAYIEMLQKPEDFPFIIGPACTLAADPIALDLTTTNIIAISYYVTSPQFSNKFIYPNFFRVYPTELTLINARVNFIKSQGWTRVAIIVESVSLFTSAVHELRTQLDRENIDFSLYLIFDFDNIEETVEAILDEKYTIFIGLFYPNFAVPIMCEFYKQQSSVQMVWLLDGWLPMDFWNGTAGVDCKPRDISGLLEYSIFFDHDLLTKNESTPTLLGPNSTEFNSIFNSDIIEDNLIFDTFSAMVAAIQKYDTLYGDTCVTDNLCLDDFNYQQTEIANRLREILTTISFQGTTGDINFTTTGDRYTNVTLNQFLNSIRVPIGNSSGKDSGISISGIKWPGGTPPNDGSQELKNFISLAQFIVFTCLAVGGIVSSIVYIVIMLIRWKHKAISSYTPLLTLTTLIGSIILYVGTIFLQIPSLEYLTDNRVGFDITCSLINWILTIGFTVTFYPLFLKMVYTFYIKEYKLKNVAQRKTKFTLEQFHLLIILAAFLILDVLFLIIWTSIPQIRSNQQEDIINKVINGLPVKSIEFNCRANNSVDQKIVIGILIGSKVVILVISMVIAFDTRALKFKKHRENIWVGISLYAVAVLGVIGVICHQFILQQADLRFGLVIMCILVAVASTTNLLFIPVIFLLFRDPKGSEDYGAELGNSEPSIDTDLASKYEQKVWNLKQENKLLTQEVEGYRNARQNSQTKLVGKNSPTDPCDYLLDSPAKVKRESVL